MAWCDEQTCPWCDRKYGLSHVAEIDKKIELFGKEPGRKWLRLLEPATGAITIDPALAALCDDGDIERYDGDIARLGESISGYISREPSSESVND